MTDQQVHQHPLLTHYRKPIGSFAELKELWQGAAIYEMLPDLLHAIPKVPYGRGETLGERICFLLDVADGHVSHLNSPLSFVRGEHYAHSSFGFNVSTSDILRDIASKAFRVMVLQYFKLNSDVYKPIRNAEWLCVKGVVEKVLWFFRADDEGRINNLPNASPKEKSDHNSTITRNLCALRCSQSSRR